MIYTLNDIIPCFPCSIIAKGDLNMRISSIHTDSRKIVHEKETLFIALVGLNHDGHNFILDAHQKGVRAFIVSKVPENLDLFTDSTILKTDNSLSALQHLAIMHRKKFNIPVIGITGSNGKTIVKEWLYQLISPDRNIVRSPKSYNSQLGVPLSVWNMDTVNELAIFEAGISEADEMSRLQPIIQPTIGLFTNIGTAHDENFIHINQKIGEKLKLFTKAEIIVYCSDHFSIRDRIQSSGIGENKRLFSWGSSIQDDLQIVSIKSQINFSILDARFDNRSITIQIPFTDKASIENAIHCWAIMLILGYDESVISQRMQKLAPVAMRLELREGIHECSIINDTYNSDVNSLTIALDFLNQHKRYKRKTVILSDILQTGRRDSELYMEVAELLRDKGINRILGIGKAIKAQQDQFRSLNGIFYSDTETFLKEVDFSDFSNEIILIKGARIFEFERISQLLEQKTHQTVMEINLNALTKNLNYYKSLLKPETGIMAMVKAFAYGSGAFEITNHLQFHRVDYLAVAYADEGVELRNGGISLPIMVMNPEEQSLYFMIKYKLEPEIYSIRLLKQLISALDTYGHLSTGPLSIHLKIDTGMHRLGFSYNDLTEMLDIIEQSKDKLVICSVFSHLAASDEPENDAFTYLQIERFNKASEEIKNRLNYNFKRHILNSNGIVRFPQAQFDLVRPGIGLYGLSSAVESEGKTEEVITLKTIISQIRTIDAGETVGYSLKCPADHPRKIATLPIGYADGLDRRLGNGTGKVMIENSVASIIGNICMDMCMIDITHIPNVQEGDSVVIFGPNHSLKNYADAIGTIPYEALTSISPRVKRVYIQE